MTQPQVNQLNWLSVIKAKEVKEKKLEVKSEVDYTQNDIVKIIEKRIEQKESLIKIRAEFSDKNIDEKVIDLAFIKFVQVNYKINKRIHKKE